MIQSDSLALDLDETLRACRTLHRRAAVLLDEEIDFVRRHRVRLIAADIPPLAFEIAARASIPAVAVSNFTWDFVYRAYSDQRPGFLPLALEMEQFYAKASLALTLPYPCEMTMFRRREAIPWIARISRLTSAEAKNKFALQAGTPIVLLSFGGFGLQRLPWAALAGQHGFHFVASGGAKRSGGNISILTDAQVGYEDLIRAADVIVTKPGYGIIADALAHRVPVLYTDRGDYPEYPRLVEALEECATAGFIPQSELLAGNLAPYVSRLLQRQPNWPAVELDGAAKAAQKMLALLDG
jgi:L-arabinokinase